MGKGKKKNVEKDVKEIFPYATEKEEQEFLKFSDDEDNDCQSNSDNENSFSQDAKRACDVDMSDDDDDNSDHESEDENEAGDVQMDEDMDSNGYESDQQVDRKSAREQAKVYAERNKRTIFVGNITPKVTKKVLQQLFNSKKAAGEGAVETIRIRGAVSSEESRSAQSKRKAVILKTFAGGENQVLCAFVVLKKAEDVDKCLHLNNHVLDGKHIRVDRVKGKKMSFIPGNCVFVGNLPYSVNEEIMRENFESCGEIINIRLIRSKQDGKPIGIGYVEFTESLGVDFAIKQSGTMTIDNRAIRIQKWSEESTQKNKRKAPVAQKEKSKPKVVVPSNLKGIELREFIQSKKKKLMKKADKKREFVKKKQQKKPKADK